MRLFWLTCCAFFCLSLLSCYKKQDLQAQLEQKKVRIAIAPLIDVSKHRLSWNVAQEITTTLYENLVQKNSYEILPPHKLKKQESYNDPFSSDLSWVKPLFLHQDFVCFTTLIEHTEKPSYPEEEVSISDSPTDLRIILKMRLVDLRKETVTLILDKTFEKTQHIPKQFSCFNFTQVAWKKPMYTFSPIGVVHAELIDNITHQIDEVILK